MLVLQGVFFQVGVMFLIQRDIAYFLCHCLSSTLLELASFTFCSCRSVAVSSISISSHSISWPACQACSATADLSKVESQQAALCSFILAARLLPVSPTGYVKITTVALNFTHNTYSLSSGGVGSLTFVRIRHSVSIILNIVLIRTFSLSLHSGLYCWQRLAFINIILTLFILSPVCVGPCMAIDKLFVSDCCSLCPKESAR